MRPRRMRDRSAVSVGGEVRAPVHPAAVRAPLMRSRPAYAVAASGKWFDEEDNRRLPAGEVHAWERGTNQTLCGLSLFRSGLARFPHVAWPDVMPESGGAADEVGWVCPRCSSGAGRARGRTWTRTAPRP